ncbi:MFS transporter [Dickeya chrysanthemi]|uniref:MFS transporter n=1 Tax=Dickeya chrysanthemi TaxID=556 RepID=UPI0003AA0E9F|nr:MFS transporter [Dickeya chrysanthemi]MBX9447412.1 MFS transporter [Dickeya chrysanthemi]MCA7008921.1 MFS transporter [Dickeya chrysanthemi]
MTNGNLWRLWPLVIGTFALGLDAYVLAGLLPSMAITLQTTQASIGLGVALFTAAYAISAPLLAPVFASRTSARFALISGIVTFILGNLITLLSHSLSWLLFSRLLAGCGAGIFSPLTSACAAGMVDESHKGRALALVLAGLSVGTALGVPAGLMVENRFGWRATIGLIALLGIISMAGMLFNRLTFSAPKAIPFKERLSALASRLTLMTLMVTVLTGIASLGLYTFIAEISADKGMGQEIPKIIWSWGIGGLIGAMFVGQVIDRLISPWLTTLTLITLLVSSFIAFGYGSLYFCLAGTFFWGLAGWSSIAPQQHSLINYAPEHAVSLIGWNSSANYAGGSIGVVVGATILNANNHSSSLPLFAILVALLALIIHLMKNFINNTPQ